MNEAALKAPKEPPSDEWHAENVRGCLARLREAVSGAQGAGLKVALHADSYVALRENDIGYNSRDRAKVLKGHALVTREL